MEKWGLTGNYGEDTRPWTKVHDQFQGERLKKSLYNAEVPLMTYLQMRSFDQANGNLYLEFEVPHEFEEKALRVSTRNLLLSKQEAQEKAAREAECDWLAMNVVEFYIHIRLLYKIVGEHLREEYPGRNQGFPPGFQYRIPKQAHSTGAEYVDFVIQWVDQSLTNFNIFPEDFEDRYPADFSNAHVKKICNRLCRVYAILYSRCVPFLSQKKAVGALHLSFKLFYYYVRR